MSDPRRTLALNLLLAATALVFAIGVWAPLITLKKLIVVKNTFSVLSGIAQLALDGQYGLFIIIFVFTLALPVLKMTLLFRALNGESGATQQRHLHWMSVVGKWSMLDVFVVAVLIASVKLGALATIEIHYGLYLFAIAVISMMLGTHLVHRQLQHPG